MIPIVQPSRRERRKAARLQSKAKPFGGAIRRVAGIDIRTSTHECGHVVVAMEYGFPVDAVRLSLECVRPGKSGPGTLSVTVDYSRPLEVMAVGLAGIFTENIILGHNSLVMSDQDLNLVRAAQARIVSPGNHWATARGMAERIIKARAETIRKMAALLLERLELNAAEIAEVMGAS